MNKKIILVLLALSLTFACSCFNTETSGNSSTEQNNISSSEMASSNIETSGEEASSAIADNSSKEESSEEEAYCLVQFDTDGAGDIASIQVETGEKIAEPITPQKTSKDCEYQFLGWFLGEEEWDFENDVVVEDMTLVAHWKAENKYSNPFLPKD